MQCPDGSPGPCPQGQCTWATTEVAAPLTVSLSAADRTCACHGLAWLRRWGQEVSPVPAVMPQAISACSRAQEAPVGIPAIGCRGNGRLKGDGAILQCSKMCAWVAVVAGGALRAASRSAVKCVPLATGSAHANCVLRHSSYLAAMSAAELWRAASAAGGMPVGHTVAA